VGGKRLRCRADELAGLAGTGQESTAGGGAPAGGGLAGSRTQRGERPGRSVLELPERESAPPELLLIGQRVEGALDRLDAYLDDALLAGREEVRVVHGHGTGRLRDAVREHLRAHPAVASLRAGDEREGGNGATVVRLRG
jgi:DNA mismatch repair protein MutS2